MGQRYGVAGHIAAVAATYKTMAVLTGGTGVQLKVYDFMIDARLDIDDLGDLIGTSIPDEDWDTVGGLILGLAGRVPAEGESFEFSRHTLTVERVQGRRVAQIRLHP